MIRSPSKFTSLSRILQIKKDNCVGEGGKEYSLEELDALIVEKQNKKAAESLQRAPKQENDLYVSRYGINPDPCPFDAAIAKAWRERVWDYICKFDNIHNEPESRAKAKRKMFTLQYL